METWFPPSDLSSKHLPATPSQPDRRSNGSYFYTWSTETTAFGQELISSPSSSLTIKSKCIENETLVISWGWGRYAEHQRLFCRRRNSQAKVLMNILWSLHDLCLWNLTTGKESDIMLLFWERQFFLRDPEAGYVFGTAPPTPNSLGS